MTSIKETISNTEALHNKLEDVLESGLPDFISATQNYREKVKGNIRFVVTAILFLLAIFIFLFLTGVQFDDGWRGKTITFLALAWTTIFLVYGRALFSNTKMLAREMNMALAPMMTDTLGRMFLYTHNDDHKKETKQMLVESELMTIEGIEVETDDMYSVYGDREASFRELVVTKPVKENNETKDEIFRGLFVVTKLSRSHNAETYISTDGDRSGFAHIDFWLGLVGKNSVQETVLEWNDFEEHLHVASNNASAAREILTPDFMQHLYEWWQEHELNIRISFKGDYFYMLLPDSKIRIDSVTTSSKPKVIQQYAWSLLLPIWRSLLLVEDVSR